MNPQAFKAFDCKRAPFTGAPTFGSADVRRVSEAVRWAVANQGATAICGGVGYGKTSSVWDALTDLTGRGQARVIDVISPDRRQLLIAAVEVAVLTELAPDRPQPHNAERRAIRVREVLGEASRKTPLVVLIDEAQALKSPTLKALKRLRELRWAGRSPLFSLLLVGHPELRSHLERITEVGLRTDLVEMQGLAAGTEGVAYLRHCLDAAQARKDAWTDAALELVARSERAPLALGVLAGRVMEQAWLSGHSQVTPEDAARVLDIKVCTQAPAVKAEDLAASIAARRKTTAAAVG